MAGIHWISNPVLAGLEKPHIYNHLCRSCGKYYWKASRGPCKRVEMTQGLYLSVWVASVITFAYSNSDIAGPALGTTLV